MTRLARTAIAAACAACAACAAACGDDGGSAGADAAVDARPACARPALDAPWLPSLLSGAVARLAAAPRAQTSEREAARAILVEELAASGWTAERHDFPGGQNVFVTIPPTEGGPAAPAVIVGAHFDSYAGSPGADDNASGVAVVLALARYLTELTPRAAPVTLAFFDQEEPGLFGSRAFAERFTPAAVRAVHTIDQVGWDGDGDRRFELERPSQALAEEWQAAARVVGAELTLTPTGGTDHESFRNAGFAAVGLTEEYLGGDASPHRHMPEDTPATLDAAYLALAARLTAQVVFDEVCP